MGRTSAGSGSSSSLSGVSDVLPQSANSFELDATHTRPATAATHSAAARIPSAPTSTLPVFPTRTPPTHQTPRGFGIT